jgi:hypothetical protein
MSSHYKVKLHDGVEVGPLDALTMRTWYEQGTIGRDSPVREQGARDWQRLIDAVDIQSWGASGRSRPRGSGPEVAHAEGAKPPSTAWRIHLASVIFMLVAVGAAWVSQDTSRFIPRLRGAPWREMSLGAMVLSLLLVRGWEPMRKLVRVVVFVLAFSLFPITGMLIASGLDWRMVGVLAGGWVAGSGLFFFLAGGRPPRASVGLALLWVVAGTAATCYLGYVPRAGTSASTAGPAPR